MVLYCMVAAEYQYRIDQTKTKVRHRWYVFTSPAEERAGASLMLQAARPQRPHSGIPAAIAATHPQAPLPLSPRSAAALMLPQTLKDLRFASAAASSGSRRI